MTLKLIVPLLVLLLPLSGLLFFRMGFLPKQKAPGVAEEKLLKKLNIEKWDKPVPARDFALKDLQGNTVRLQDFKGKVVFLNFWATWCPPCRLEMPTMEELHQEFGNRGLVILAINYRERPDEIRDFFAEYHLTFSSLLDQEGKVMELYQAWSFPATYLINKKGEIVGKVVGYRDWQSEHARTFFRRLLEDKT